MDSEKEYLTSESQRVANKRYYERNKERIKGYANQWLKENPERRKELQREYYKRKKAKIMALVESGNPENP